MDTALDVLWDKLPSCSVIVHEDDAGAEKICPICKCELKMYQINFEEKFLMCPRLDCAYPISVSDYHLYKSKCKEYVLKIESDNSSTSSSAMSVTTGSTISNSDWSEIDRIVMDDLTPVDSATPSLVEKLQLKEKLKELKKSEQEEMIMKKNLRKIKEITKQLYKPEEPECVNTDRWIKHIAKMQERCGAKLLKNHELEKAKKLFGASEELKVNIDTMRNKISFEIEAPDEHKKE